MPLWQLIHGRYGVNNIRFLIVYRGSAYAIVAAHTWMFSATLIYIIVTKVYEDTWFGM